MAAAAAPLLSCAVLLLTPSPKCSPQPYWYCCDGCIPPATLQCDCADLRMRADQPPTPKPLHSKSNLAAAPLLLHCRVIVPSKLIEIRLDKLDDVYGSPGLEDIERFSRALAQVC